MAGDPIIIGSISINALPTVLPRVIELLQALASRGERRTVKFKSKGIEFEGSVEELQKLLETLHGDSTTNAPPPKKR
jgi:hypothetical protein